MSDDLIKRLRDPSTSSQASTARHEAADRIEQLEEQVEQWKAGFALADAKWGKVLIKRDKAVAALRHTLDKPRDADQSYAELCFEVMREIRTTLAELEGKE